MHLCGQFLVFVLLLCLLPASSQAQADADSARARVHLLQQLVGGVEAYHNGWSDRGEAALRRAFEADPALMADSVGSAAYWLGLILSERDEKEALAVWHSGAEALMEAGLFDAHLAAAYVQASVQAASTGHDLTVTSEQYLLLLENADAVPVEVLSRHLAQVEGLLSEEEREQWVEKVGGGKWPLRRLRPGAGPEVAAWWRSRDAMPATVQNERVVEHLERVAFAEQEYAHRKRPEGYDDRGVIYVRLGAPFRQKEILFRAEKAMGRFSADGIMYAPVELSIPSTQIWIYEDLGINAYYLFVMDEADGDYRISTTEHLIPEKYMVTLYRNQDTQWGNILSQRTQGPIKVARYMMLEIMLLDIYEQDRCPIIRTGCRANRG